MRTYVYRYTFCVRGDVKKKNTNCTTLKYLKSRQYIGVLQIIFTYVSHIHRFQNKRYINSSQTFK